MSTSEYAPVTQYRDDPSQSYRDNPTITTASNDEENLPSIFDWGGSTSATTASNGSNKANATASTAVRKQKKKSTAIIHGAPFQIESSFDPDVEIPFTPISLHDDDDEESETLGGRLHPHTRRHGGNRYGPVDSGHIDDEYGEGGGEGGDGGERLFVGGGWGRHGSSTDYRCSPKCRCERRFCCGRTPHGHNNKNNSFLCSTTGCFLIVFVTLTLLSGYLGYEAGLPISTNVAIETEGDGGGMATTQVEGEPNVHTSIPTTHGEQWLHWIESEKDKIHLPHIHLNFTKRHKPSVIMDDNNNQQLTFPKMGQEDLLTLSEHVFQSCSERSIATIAGRDACLSLCHGHYCCFEKDVQFGSCVSTPNSYCFVYAACENVIMDFGFTNVNTEEKKNIKSPSSSSSGSSGGGGGIGKYWQLGLNELDIELLKDTCSTENVAKLEGIRDCSAFCQHHLCCFSDDEDENCADEFVAECEAYSPCKIVAEGPSSNGGSGSSAVGGAGTASASSSSSLSSSTSSSFTPEQIEKHVYDACYFGNDESKVTQSLIARCHNICSPRYCCFDNQNFAPSCLDTMGQAECNLYALCEQMINDHGEEVKDFIELDKLEFGDTESSPAITPSSNGGSNNVNSNIVKNEGGLHAFTDESEFQATLEQVKTVCDPDQTDPAWVTNCHELCANYLCCSSTEGTGSNCQDIYDKDVCAAYEGCSVLLEQPTTTSTSSQQTTTNSDLQLHVQLDEIQETCVPKIRRDPNLRERCRKACEPRDCCWQSGPGNCYQMNTEWCDEFDMCEILVV